MTEFNWRDCAEIEPLMQFEVVDKSSKYIKNTPFFGKVRFSKTNFHKDEVSPI